MDDTIFISFTKLTVPVGSECCFSTWPNGDCDVLTYITSTSACEISQANPIGPVYLRVSKSIPLLLQNNTTLLLRSSIIDAYTKSIEGCFSVKAPTIVSTAPAYTVIFLSLFTGMLLLLVCQQVFAVICSKRGRAYVRHVDRTDV